MACSLPATLQFASPAETVNINFKNLVLTLNGASAVMTKYMTMFSDHQKFQILQMISG